MLKKIHHQENNKQNYCFAFASLPVEKVLEKLKSSLKGLSEEEASQRIQIYGYNEPAKKKKRRILWQILLKFTNPLVVVLIIIASVSFFLGEKINAFIISLMAGMSIFMSFIQEYRAGKEAERLSEMVRVSVTVYRNGKAKELKINELVPGDIVDLFAGDMIPADLRIIQAKDLFVNQASLTGESLPVEKTANTLSLEKPVPITELNNIAFMGSSVVSGTGLGVVIATGLSTQFGVLAKRLERQSAETAFDKGIRSFTWMMIRIMLLLIATIFFIIFFFKKSSTLEAFLFSISVAVGLTPEMLPMLVTINLSKGAISMSKKQVIVKRLNAIQNFGAMDVLCTDKTGTLTLDKIVLEKHCDVIRRDDEDILRFAYINSFYQTGLKNILDRAILKHEKIMVKQFKKIDEVPFDFSRKMMSVVVEFDSRHRMITKGAPEEVFKRCSKYELDGEILDMEQLILTDLKEEYDKLSAEGFRVLAIAYRDFLESKEVYSKEDEKELILKGYVAFLDPPKPSARKTIERLKNLGIDFKILTGDNELVTKKICAEIDIPIQNSLTGEELMLMSDEELKEKAKYANVFTRLSPFQKERVIRALHANGHIVGYLGDGINDALALKAADVGISVDNATDIAKESADIILLKKSLLVLSDGVIEGRRTFGNILKYIKMGSSSNFGNMISVTGASLFLSFLPMLPIQILLNNFLYDLSQVAIPSDEIDKEYLLKCRPWNINYIKRFMLFLGPVSSFFDFLTFAILLFIFKAGPQVFRTGWFLESLCTQTLVIHIIRTGKIPFFESKPSQFLVFTSLYIITLGVFIPFTPLGKYFSFVVPPASYFLVLLLIITFYLLLAQKVKVWFIKKYGYE